MQQAIPSGAALYAAAFFSYTQKNERAVTYAPPLGRRLKERERERERERKRERERETGE